MRAAGHRVTVADVAAQLRKFHGHRTVWVDAQGQLWHSEPEQELETIGWHYVGTFMRPDDETLEIAVRGLLPGRAAPSPTPQPTLGMPGFAPA